MKTVRVKGHYFLQRDQQGITRKHLTFYLVLFQNDVSIAEAVVAS